MNKQPPEDFAALVQAVKELVNQVARMRADLDQLVDKRPSRGYYHQETSCQDPTGKDINIAVLPYRLYGRDKNNPPLVPYDTPIQCVRCHREWTPYARRPKKCPSCKAPWWFLPKWRRQQSQTESQR